MKKWTLECKNKYSYFPNKKIPCMHYYYVKYNLFLDNEIYFKK